MSSWVNYTTGTVKQINYAWSLLESHLGDRHSRFQVLADCLKYEWRSKDNPNISRTNAKALVIGWFLDGFDRPMMPIGNLYGIRMAAKLARIEGAEFFLRPPYKMPTEDFLMIIQECRVAFDQHQRAFDKEMRAGR